MRLQAGSVVDGSSEVTLLTMPINFAVVDGSVEALNLLYLYVISAHDGEMDVVPLPSSHLASQRYDLGSAFHVGSSEEDIFINFTLAAQSRNGMQR